MATGISPDFITEEKFIELFNGKFCELKMNNPTSQAFGVNTHNIKDIAKKISELIFTRYRKIIRATSDTPNLNGLVQCFITAIEGKFDSTDMRGPCSDQELRKRINQCMRSYRNQLVSNPITEDKIFSKKVLCAPAVLENDNSKRLWSLSIAKEPWKELALDGYYQVLSNEEEARADDYVPSGKTREDLEQEIRVATPPNTLSHTLDKLKKLPFKPLFGLAAAAFGVYALRSTPIIVEP